MAQLTLKFSNRLSFLFNHLYERSFMTPTYLSTLIMYAILPATFLIDKNDIPTISDYKDHKVTRFKFKDLDTVEYCKPGNMEYILFFGGNGEDAVQWRRGEDDTKNYVFWNYPRVGLSKGISVIDPFSAYTLFEAGYQQAKRLLDEKKISPEHLTLDGYSLGGAIATHVARRLHQEGYPVNLTVDRSFSRVARVPPARIDNTLRDRAISQCNVLRVKSLKDVDLKRLPKDYPTVIRADEDDLDDPECKRLYVYGFSSEKKWKISSFSSSGHGPSFAMIWSKYPLNEVTKLYKSTDNNLFNYWLFEDLSHLQAYQHTYKRVKHAPFVTAVVAFAVSGIALGTTVSGLLATAELCLSTALATLSYLIASMIQAIGHVILALPIQGMGMISAYLVRSSSTIWAQNIQKCFNTVAYGVEFPFAALGFFMNEIVQGMALSLHFAMNGLSTLIGAAIALIGCLVGSLIGVVFGAVASLQCLVTTNPFSVPITFALSAALISSCCEMDSVNHMRRLLIVSKREKTHSNIQVINTMDDRAIPPYAALGTGLSILQKQKKNNSTARDKKPLLKSNRHVFWYKNGGHSAVYNDLYRRTRLAI